MKNIVYIINQLRNSGPVRVLLDICQNLDRSKYQPYIITLMNEDPQRSIAQKFKDINVKIIEFHFSFIQLELNTANIASIITKRISPLGSYIIHAHCYHPILIASKINTPTTCTIHSISKDDYVISKGYIIGNYMSYRLRHNLHNITHPIAISEYMYSYYKNVCNNKLSVIYNGVSCNIYENLPSKEDLYKKLAIDSKKKIIIVTGHLSKLKNPTFIIKELKKSQRQDFMCIFIGDGNEKEKCIQYIDGDPRFRLEGYVFNVKEYLKIADFFISASFTEGLPLAVIEALNMGIASLISAIPPHKEIAQKIDHTMVNTFSFEENELLNKFEAYLDKSYSRHEIANKSINLFSSKNMTLKYENVYDKLFNEQ